VRRSQFVSVSRRVFVDSSAYFALSDQNEQRHASAKTVLEGLATQRWHLFTTNFVVAEAHALLLNRLGRRFARRLLHDVDHGATTIVRVAPQDERRAREILSQYDDKDFSLTDAISFAVMERLRIAHAFSFDHHFSQYGLTILIPDRF
jgi:predicted nucleic acid-binding protein